MHAPRAAELLERLDERGWRLGIAEAACGGLLAAHFVGVPGASRVFAGGIVAYANDAKHALLGVEAALVEAHGVVSAEVALAMADGARAAFGADVGLAESGIAGPRLGRGSAKRIGSVAVAVVTPASRHAHLIDTGDGGGRDAVRARFVDAACALLAERLREQDG